MKCAVEHFNRHEHVTDQQAPSGYAMAVQPHCLEDPKLTFYTHKQAIDVCPMCYPCVCTLHLVIIRGGANRGQKRTWHYWQMDSYPPRHAGPMVEATHEMFHCIGAHPGQHRVLSRKHVICIRALLELQLDVECLVCCQGGSELVAQLLDGGSGFQRDRTSSHLGKPHLLLGVRAGPRL